METVKLIDFSKIEKKWQRRWAKESVFEARDGKGQKYYVMEMYPYPSGKGLHMGHALNYTIGDIRARFKRMQGFNVLYPMGFDSFGLPAENAAIKHKSHPKKFTEEAIKNFVKQQKSLGLSYDWSRMLMSHKPEYYKWDQWIFLKMLEKGLAYRKSAPVNYCRKCSTVLANEQVVDGRCWRHEDCEVEIKHLEQWFLKITDYAEELFENIDNLVGWPEAIRTMQKNWIGKSLGVEVDFLVDGKKWPIFTTRVDTIFGVTFMVVSAQHPKLMDLVSAKQMGAVKNFLKRVKSVKEEDIGKLDKEGVFTGAYAEHPLTGEKIPIWTGNFVVADYGGGMVMGVPAHDGRDFEFAKKYKLDVKQVISSGNSATGKIEKAYVGDGVLVESGEFDGLKSKEAKEKILMALLKVKKGRKKVAFKLRDWLISRQRFWGCPIPIIYCDKCGVVAVEEKDLPVKLPENIKFTSKKNPLESCESFINVKCPECGGKAKRETDTMDTFVDSAWYFLRYCDPKNKKGIFDKKKVNYWAPVDFYIGGKEHATGHLIYFRFFTKFLRDFGLLKFDEPVTKLFNQGMLHGQDGRKMSKSYGNVINPDEMIEKYGADVLRIALVSSAGPDRDSSWSDKIIEGSHKFVLRVVDYFDKVKIGKSNKRAEHKVNKGIKLISEHIDNLKYNLGVIELREMFYGIESEAEISKKDLESFVKMFSVFCPHLGEEIWEKIGGSGFVSLSAWPKMDEKKIDEKIDKGEKAAEKIVEDVGQILKILEQKGKIAQKIYIYVLPQEIDIYDGKKIGKRVGKEVVVFSVSDKSKYDPEGKSKKVKPWRPGIFVE